MPRTVRIELKHDYQPDSNPYEPDVESAFQALVSKGLPERGWSTSVDPGIIRHETGPEIFVMVASILELSVAILHLVHASRKHHPETTVNITVADPEDVRRVLEALGAPART